MATNRKPREPRAAKRPKATTPEGRESQLISLAYDLAEEQLLDGSASAMVITHWLKLGTTRAKLEEEKLRKENLLLEAKAEQIGSAQKQEVMYEKAVQAIRSYQGHAEEEDEDLY